MVTRTHDVSRANWRLKERNSETRGWNTAGTSHSARLRRWPSVLKAMWSHGLLRLEVASVAECLLSACKALGSITTPPQRLICLILLKKKTRVLICSVAEDRALGKGWNMKAGRERRVDQGIMGRSCAFNVEVRKEG